jgi:methionine--tRNA ligase beta chain
LVGFFLAAFFFLAPAFFFALAFAISFSLSYVLGRHKKFSEKIAENIWAKLFLDGFNVVSAMISSAEFKRVDMRVGAVVGAERVKGTDRLLKLSVDFGDHKRTVITGLAHLYPPEHFVGRQFVFVINLEPRKIRNEVSEAMLLTAVEDEEKIVPVAPEKEVAPGTRIM